MLNLSSAPSLEGISELPWCSLPLSSSDGPRPACCSHAVGLLEANRNIFLSKKSGL